MSQATLPIQPTSQTGTSTSNPSNGNRTTRRRRELAGVLGDDEGRKRELREPHRIYTEMRATGHVELVGRELAILSELWLRQPRNPGGRFIIYE